MTSFEDRQRAGRHGTDIPSYQAVQDAVKRIARTKYSGWRASDRGDLEQVVMAKYFKHFGRDRLPDGADGRPKVPTTWLTKVLKNTAVDFHRQNEARPFDAVDFHDEDAAGLERLNLATNTSPSLASAVARSVDLNRALAALGDAYPSDADIIRWRIMDDHDLATTARLAGKSEEATKKAVQRAMVRLRDLLDLMPATLA